MCPCASWTTPEPLRTGGGRRDRSQGTECFRGVLADAGEDARGIHRRRLLSHRRHGQLLSNRYLRIVGRAKDLIITGGLNVYPKEIEEKIDALPGVVESAVIGVADADFGEAVTAIVVPGADHALTEAAIIAALKTEIASFKVPKRVHFVDDLPRNSMGKVQKNVLRDRYDPAKQ